MKKEHVFVLNIHLLQCFKYWLVSNAIVPFVESICFIPRASRTMSFHELKTKRRNFWQINLLKQFLFRSTISCIFCFPWVGIVEINPMLFLLSASPETLWFEWLSEHHQIHQLDSKKCYPRLSPSQQMLRFLYVKFLYYVNTTVLSHAPFPFE